ncbi:MAG: 5-carboxymethyl-2-hydroxymuconate semialdehyde dehydrogenase, partial [Pseudomonadota bacterium]
ETFETVSPIDSTVICTVAKGDTADVDQAAQAAHPSRRAASFLKQVLKHKIDKRATLRYRKSQEDR